MKPLMEFFNTDKAGLLFDMFPGQIPKLVAFFDSHSQYIINNADILRAEWDSGFFSFDHWLMLANAMQDILKKHGEKLHTRRQLFIRELFEMRVLFFAVDATVKYAARSDNKKFAAMVDVLFNN